MSASTEANGIIFTPDATNRYTITASARAWLRACLIRSYMELGLGLSSGC